MGSQSLLVPQITTQKQYPKKKCHTQIIPSACRSLRGSPVSNSSCADLSGKGSLRANLVHRLIIREHGSSAGLCAAGVRLLLPKSTKMAAQGLESSTCGLRGLLRRRSARPPSCHSSQILNYTTRVTLIESSPGSKGRGGKFLKEAAASSRRHQNHAKHCSTTSNSWPTTGTKMALPIQLGTRQKVACLEALSCLTEESLGLWSVLAKSPTLDLCASTLPKHHSAEVSISNRASRKQPSVSENFLTASSIA
jgi:hypothetical protein